MQLPSTRPESDPTALVALQNELLAVAEHLLGPRDLSKTIFRPAFDERGPRLRNTSALDGAFIELSFNAKGYWPTVVYEMAHECVHLLNPTVSYTNWLEEGIAVEFSILMLAAYELPPLSPPPGPYLEALEMVRALPGGSLTAARAARSAAGALNAVTFNHLTVLFPEADEPFLRRLTEQCIPR